MQVALLYDSFVLKVEEVNYPQLEEENLIIKIHRASVCNGSDAALYSGRRRREVAYPWMKFPWIVGHECAGEVVEVGKKVKGFKIGDRVASLKYGNAFAEYQAVLPEQLIPLPSWLSYEEGTFVEPLYTTFAYTHYLREGDIVVVCGAGPSGTLLLQGCLALGAAKVGVIDKCENRLQVAKKLGAHLTLKADDEKMERILLDQLGEIDIFIDATGYDVYDLGIRLLKPGGKLIMYGVPDSGVNYDGTRAFFKGIQFCNEKEYPPQKVVGRALKLVQEGKIKLQGFTTHHFPLSGVPEAINLALNHPEKCLGIVIDIA